MRFRWAVALTASAVLVSGCVSVGVPLNPPPLRRAPERSTPPLVLGTFDFSESRTLGNIYAAALRDRGFEVRLLNNIASREVMQPAIDQGFIDLVPEYLGSAFLFRRRASRAPAFAAATYGRFQRDLQPAGVVAADFAAAQNKNVIVVSEELARTHDLRKVSDLRGLADRLTFGGPPECPGRFLCLGGLRAIYDLEFAAFRPLDVGGPLTVAALRGGEIDVGLLFSTNPALETENFVVLRDDGRLQPPENVVPLIRQEVIDSYGGAFLETLNEVSAELSTDDLRHLNRLVDVAGLDAYAVAQSWLNGHGLLEGQD